MDKIPDKSEKVKRGLFLLFTFVFLLSLNYCARNCRVPETVRPVPAIQR